MKIWQYGDNINTDMLFPGKYTYTCSTAEEIKLHLLEDLDSLFAKNVKEGDLIFAGRNFGCGSSREQPVLGIKAVGIAAVVAESFARIFYRSSINQGLLLIECPEAIRAYKQGDNVCLNVKKGTIVIGSDTFTFQKLPKEILAIRDSDGLLPYTRKKLRQKKKQ
jgi:3-isopropylmalate/(R)-2-methylmalate dehydratase small subunit